MYYYKDTYLLRVIFQLNIIFPLFLTIRRLGMEHWETAELEIIEFDTDDKSIITAGSKENNGEAFGEENGTNVFP